MQTAIRQTKNPQLKDILQKYGAPMPEEKFKPKPKPPVPVPAKVPTGSGKLIPKEFVL